jgi:hypothetical protein
VIRAPRWQRYLATSLCAYEIVALWSPLPTITNIVHRLPVLKAPVLAVLDVHFEPGGAW